MNPMRERDYSPKDGRLKAASTCRERGWVIGTWLCSATWKAPRKVSRFDPKETSEFVRFVTGKGGGACRVMILPEDVRVVPKCEECDNYAEHVEMLYKHLHHWCAKHVPMSGHFEFCGDQCKKLIASTEPTQLKRCVHGCNPPSVCKDCIRQREATHAVHS